MYFAVAKFKSNHFVGLEACYIITTPLRYTLLAAPCEIFYLALSS